MGRKVDIKLVLLENKAKYIEGRLDFHKKVSEQIIAKHTEAMVQMRDLLTKLIEGR